MSNTPLSIAIVGATGAVGRAMMSILEQSDLNVENLYLLASERSRGELLDFRRKSHQVQVADEFDFSKAQIALFSAGGDTSKRLAPKAAVAKCLVIDNSSAFRYEEDVPLVVPEVNPEKIADYHKRYIIANPNCSTIQMVVALKPLHDAATITRINVATYQAVSGAGHKGVSELIKQTGELLNGRQVEPEAFTAQIAFNVIPQIDVFQDNGYTKEEMKMVWETQKILGDDSIKVNPTAVRVPVVYGHSEALHLETKDKLTAEQAREILSNAKGVRVIDDTEKGVYPTPLSQGTGSDAVFVGRIREDISLQNGLNLWVVADNVRKGAALNAVQIASHYVRTVLG